MDPYTEGVLDAKALVVASLRPIIVLLIVIA